MLFKDREITIEEAVAIMKQTRVKVASGNVRDFESARSLLIKVAGYRVPMKPLNKELGETVYISGECPTCKNMVDEIEDTKFCHECGQRLSWKLF